MAKSALQSLPNDSTNKQPRLEKLLLWPRTQNSGLCQSQDCRIPSQATAVRGATKHPECRSCAPGNQTGPQGPIMVVSLCLCLQESHSSVRATWSVAIPGGMQTADKAALSHSGVADQGLFVITRSYTERNHTHFIYLLEKILRAVCISSFSPQVCRARRSQGAFATAQAPSRSFLSCSECGGLGGSTGDCPSLRLHHRHLRSGSAFTWQLLYALP